MLSSLHVKEGKRPFNVLVEGNIGSGKTTFLQHFTKFDQVTVLKEPVEKWRNINGHNLLSLMYQDPERWSMPFQSYVQLTMMDQHMQPTDTPIKLMERSIFSARYCFVENLHRSGKMQDSELEVLDQWFQFLVNSPDLELNIDLIIYLRTDPTTAMERVIARARGEEQNCIPLKYLQDLHQLHEDWLVNHRFKVPAPVLVIDANKDLGGMQEEYERSESSVLGHISAGILKESSQRDYVRVASPAAV